MSEQIPGTVVRELQIWKPADTFNLNYNRIAFEEGLSGLRLIDVKKKSDSPELYCTGTGSDKTIYHIITPGDVEYHYQQLSLSDQRAESCFQINQSVGVREMREEAWGRELHLGLGRSALMLAHRAESPQELKAVTNDLIKVFSMLVRPVHELDSLTKTSLHSSGLIYLYVRAAIRHKNINKKEAENIAQALNSGIVPLGDGKTWRESMGDYFIKRVTTNSAKAPQKKSKKSKKDADSASRDGHKVYAGKEQLSKGNKEVRVPFFSPIAREFIATISRQPSNFKTIDAINELYDRYCVQKVSGLKPYDEETKNEVGSIGIRGYLDLLQVVENEPAHQIRLFTGAGNRRSNQVDKILMTGNLVSAKLSLHDNTDSKDSGIKLLEDQTLLHAFQAIRAGLAVAATKGKGSLETEQIKKYADILEVYLASETNETVTKPA